MVKIYDTIDAFHVNLQKQLEKHMHNRGPGAIVHTWLLSFKLPCGVVRTCGVSKENKALYLFLIASASLIRRKATSVSGSPLPSNVIITLVVEADKRARHTYSGIHNDYPVVVDQFWDGWQCAHRIS